ncbi:transglutaminase-like domain-containing protein [Gilvimarinus sp. F26214L]|uniref:transglutaminase-like domain-containing protein n=1 Tax=Gilvimarinus sp. DZF01 TaxID=3461371 RepID=UPI00404577C5
MTKTPVPQKRVLPLTSFSTRFSATFDDPAARPVGVKPGRFDGKRPPSGQIHLGKTIGKTRKTLDMSNQQQQGQSVLEAIRTPRRSLRVFAGAICVLMVNALMAPQIFAIGEELERERQANAIVLRGTNEQKLNQGLLKVQEIAARKQARLAERVQNESGMLDSVLSFVGLSQLTLEDVAQIRELADLLEDEHRQAVLNFGEVRESLEDKGVAPVILQRHDAMVEQYINRYADMTAHLQNLLNAGSLLEQQTAAEALHGFMKDQKLKKRHQFTDPDNLPWGTPDPKKTRKPAETAEELQQVTGISPLPQGIQLATNVITPDMLGNPGGPVAEDLEETPDVKLTDAIRAKAEELNHDPVEIYNWVRNTIEFIPSYGSIQGADYTLQTGKGNAFDTASLLIALYRASNIPARYAYGTVDVPADQAMNWVGGVEVPEAAQQLLGQGGIPNVAMVSGGKISHIRMEHVWVEAWIDYLPSRGAKHQVGDSWIPLDASFKQYEYIEKQDLDSVAPFDAQGLVADVQNVTEINVEEGWLHGSGESQVNAAFDEYRQQIEDYLNSQSRETTINDIVGSEKIIIKEIVQLAAGLPYGFVAQTSSFSEIPNQVRHKFRYTLGSEHYGTESARLMTFERSLPELVNSKLAISFKPATAADADLIASYTPMENDSLDDLPETLPGYLINLVVELTDDGEVLQSAEAGTMGSELFETLALWSPSQGWEQAVNHPVAGEFRTIGLGYQGVSKQRFEKGKLGLVELLETLQSADGAVISTLTKHETTGSILFAVIEAYLAQNTVQDEKQSRAANVISYRLPSYGIYSTALQTSYWFGIPRDVTSVGMAMDVDHLASQAVSKENSDKQARDFLQLSGIRASAMEHAVPEQMLHTDSTPTQGISAVKALALAGSSGQRIWEITADNLETALSSIDLDPDIENEIRNAVLVGKIATAHERPVVYANGNRVGYLIIDPVTGAGAYKIAGGGNGSAVVSAIQALLNVLGIGLDVGDLLNGLGGGPFGAFLEAVKGVVAVLTLVVGIVDIAGNPNCSIWGARYLIIVNTFATMAMLGLGAALVALGIGLIIGFVFMLVIGFLMSMILNQLENLTCRPEN